MGERERCVRTCATGVGIKSLILINTKVESQQSCSGKQGNRVATNLNGRLARGDRVGVTRVKIVRQFSIAHKSTGTCRHDERHGELNRLLCFVLQGYLNGSSCLFEVADRRQILVGATTIVRRYGCWWRARPVRKIGADGILGKLCGEEWADISAAKSRTADVEHAQQQETPEAGETPKDGQSRRE